MIFPRLLCSTAAFAMMAPPIALAQDTGQEVPVSDPQTDEGDNGDILVLGARLRGQVETDQAPILELEEADIAAYGAGSIADLVAALEPQTGSSRGRGGGRPVFLVNGVRVGSFREFRSYPPEAIRKVEVLPEETAQKFGFPPDRRVVNFILKDNFSAITLQTEYKQPDRGGYSRTEQEATLLKITKAGRINLNIELNDTSLLTEDERDIIQTPGSVSDVATDPDQARFRSLIADSAEIEASANFAKAFLDSGSSVGLNATFNRSDNRSLSGLNTVTLIDGAGNSALRIFDAGNPLERRTRTDTYSSSASYNRPLGAFNLTATADGSFADSRSEIDRRADVTALIADAASGALAIDGAIPDLADAGFDVSSTKTYTLSSKLTVRGSPLFLPAGELSTTVDLGYDWSRIDSEDSRSGSAARLTRGQFSGGLNIGIPITSTRDDVWAAIGTISLNGQVRFNNYSDFGTLLRWSGGVNWSPVDSLDLQATYVRNEVPPSLSQLGNPQITNFNVPTFDFVTGNTSLITVTSGGNPALKAETQSDWNFSANWEFMKNARFRVDYSKNKSDNVSSSFPFLTPEIEAAFPGRVTRDVNGVLTALDQRPVDFFETRTEQVTFGLNLRGSFGKARSQAQEQSQGRTSGGRPNGARRSGGRGPGAGRGPGEDRPGEGRRGPMSEEQRTAFMKFRELVCADDGEAFLLRLVEAVERGETIEELPDFDSERAQRMLSRFRNEDGTIDRERLAGLRTRMCSREGGSQQADVRPAGSRGASGGGGRRGGGFRRGDDGRGRYFFNLSYSAQLNSEVLVAPGGPALDLLDGDSLSSNGTPRNSFQLRVGAFKSGVGIRLSAKYTGKARIEGSGAPGSTDLFVDDLATFNLRLFADLGAVLKQEDGLFKGMRLAFKIDNVFDGHRIVTDNNGDIPISFQPLLTDPTGRYIGVDLRKLF